VNPQALLFPGDGAPTPGMLKSQARMWSGTWSQAVAPALVLFALIYLARK
jgi:hypothetical protein